MFETSFTGSELYEPSSGQEFITIQGNAELDVTLSSNWVHIGSTAYLTGQLIDQEKNPPGPITGNATEFTLQILGQEQIKIISLEMVL